MKLARILTGTAVTAMLLAGCTSQGAADDTGPSTSATKPVSQTPKVCPNSHGGSCLGPLEAGTYQTSTFAPQLTYTVPDGWTNDEDLPGNFLIFMEQDPQDGALGGSYLGIFQNVRAPAVNCDEVPQDGVGTTAKELVAWYQTVPGLIVSEPQHVTVGGLSGIQIDLSIEPGANTCRFDIYNGLPAIIGNGVSSLYHVVLNELDLRLVILDWHKGNVTLEITNLKKQHSAEEFRTILQPILDSLEFRG